MTNYQKTFITFLIKLAMHPIEDLQSKTIKEENKESENI